MSMQRVGLLLRAPSSPRSPSSATPSTTAVRPPTTTTTRATSDCFPRRRSSCRGSTSTSPTRAAPGRRPPSRSRTSRQSRADRAGDALDRRHADPVRWLNLYLTGYDTQSINLYEVIALGHIAPPRGTGTEISPVRFFGSEPGAQHVPLRSSAAAAAAHLPRKGAGARRRVGGYRDTAFRKGLGSPMGHIRAIPERENTATPASFPHQYRSNFPSTRYGRFTGDSRRDGRQPLPSRFATCWIEDGPGEFRTELTAWREPLTRATESCSGYAENRVQRATEYVLFDEEENAVRGAFQSGPDADFPFAHVVVASVNRLGFRDGELPSFFDGERIAGWVYPNLDDPRDDATGLPPAKRGSRVRCEQKDTTPRASMSSPWATAACQTEASPKSQKATSPSPRRRMSTRQKNCSQPGPSSPPPRRRTVATFDTRPQPVLASLAHHTTTRSLRRRVTHWRHRTRTRADASVVGTFVVRPANAPTVSCSCELRLAAHAAWTS